MYTAIRVASYEGNIADVIRKCDPNFELLPVGRKDVRKFALQRAEPTGNYIVIVSQGFQESPGYNVTITVTGPIAGKTEELMQAFEHDTGLQTRDAPKHAKEKAHALSLAARLLIPPKT